MCGYQEEGATGCNPNCGKTTVEMQEPNTFTDTGWDFITPTWMICGQDYPKLIWNYPNINGDERINFFDFAELTAYWKNFECGMCSHTDLTGDRNVDNDDIRVFVNSWLDEDKISNHVFYIDITCSWDYGSPDYTSDTAYVFEVEISTDGRIDYIEFSSPNDRSTFVIPNTPLTKYAIMGGTMEIGWEYDSDTGQYYWLYNPRFESLNSLSEYGDGLYSFTFYYTNGDQQHTTVWYGIPNTEDPIPQPTQMPIFTSFNNGDMVTSPVTFTWDKWQACTGLSASSIELDPEHESGEDMEFHLPSCATGLDEPVEMTTGFWDDVELSFELNYLFENPEGIPIRASKYSESDYEFTVVP
jgi:hypothetical protein